MTSPEHTFFVNCKFCQSYIPTSKARDFTFTHNDKNVKFTCNQCDYRSESMMYTKHHIDSVQRKPLTSSDG